MVILSSAPSAPRWNSHPSPRRGPIMSAADLRQVPRGLGALPRSFHSVRPGAPLVGSFFLCWASQASGLAGPRTRRQGEPVDMTVAPPPPSAFPFLVTFAVHAAARSRPARRCRGVDRSSTVTCIGAFGAKRK